MGKVKHVLAASLASIVVLSIGMGIGSCRAERRHAQAYETEYHNNLVKGVSSGVLNTIIRLHFNGGLKVTPKRALDIMRQQPIYNLVNETLDSNTSKLVDAIEGRIPYVPPELKDREHRR